jgi:hypothetical protein
MDRHHRANLLPYLRRNAARLQAAAVQTYQSSLGLVDDPGDGVWSAQQAIEAELELEPEDWLERKPLVRKIVALEADRPVHERAATAMRNMAYELRHTGYRKVGS